MKAGKGWKAGSDLSSYLLMCLYLVYLVVNKVNLRR